VDVSLPASIAEAVRRIHSRELSAVELTELVLARIEERNPELNAYLRVEAENALAQARAADTLTSDATAPQLPLQGVPLCIKDNIDVAGMPTTAGAARWHRHPGRDATAVARLRAAGAVIIGKGHTNEFAYGIDGANEHWGDCRNPDDPARISGGSSSGPAVATAAGMALGGLGTDTAGSLRTPASFCGVVGVRTTLGQIPTDGVVPLAWSFDTVGPLARTVDDAARLLTVLTGDTSEKPPPLPREALHGTRLGVLEQLLEAAETYVAEGVLNAARRLEARGAELVPVHLDLLPHATAIQSLIQQAEAARSHAPWFAAERDYYSEPVRTRVETGGLLPASAYLSAQQARRLLIDETAQRMQGLSALLAPAAPTIAPESDTEEITIRGTRHPLRPALLAFCLLASQLGAPAVSMPVGRRHGLAYGMQLIGRPFSESQLLGLAEACETAGRNP
jgi:aspartyl-tRNA(Asn)/glutamyl-tRNA(Gln) amidotransferase subunit A